MAAPKSLETMSGMILNQLQPKFAPNQHENAEIEDSCESIPTLIHQTASLTSMMCLKGPPCQALLWAKAVTALAVVPWPVTTEQ